MRYLYEVLKENGRKTCYTNNETVKRRVQNDRFQINC